jgi:ATP-binding protein involved in chromosome partitioning
MGGDQETRTPESTTVEERDPETAYLKQRMSRVKHKIAVISGKGGVGKSLVTANLAVALTAEEKRVGVLDADIHGPCIPKMLGLKGKHMDAGPAGIMPVVSPSGIRCASMAFLLPSDDSPVIWRGPLKMGAIKQLLAEVAWGELDYLLIDLPPGTGDEPLSVLQLLPEMDGVIIVTIPSEVSGDVVRKAVTFARQLNVPILGIIENMAGMLCPHCGKEISVFDGNAGRKVSETMGVHFLGSIPIDPRVASDSDEGTPFIAEHKDSPAANAFQGIVEKIVKVVEK